MFVELVPIVLSLLVGLARRGDIMRIARLKLVIPYAALVAIAVQVVSINAIPASAAFPILFTGSLVLVIVFLLANRAIPWTWLLAVGVSANLLVMALNGGRIPAPMVQGGGAGHRAGEAIGTHATQIDAGTVLAFLGDVIPLDLGRFGGYFVSAGDLVLALGIFLLIQAVMVPRKTRNRHYAEKAPLIDA